MKTEDGHTEGATVGEDLSGLRQPNLVHKSDRDAAEFESIAGAYDKYVYRARRKNPDGTWLAEDFIRRVHLDMFGAIWDWAGKYRTGSTNIGIDWHQIQGQIAQLIGDFQYWSAPQSNMKILEIAARLQNRLTRIHPFKNGNGRHARLLTDIFLRSRKHPLPQWPQLQRLPHGDEIRKRYLEGMRKADKENFTELMEFMEDCL